MANSSQVAAFPTKGWENNITVIPRLSDEGMLTYYSSRPGAERNWNIDPFVITSSIRSNICKISDGLVFIKATCYQSEKGDSAYSVVAAVNSEAEIVRGSCECSDGESACNHLMGVLETVSLLQSKGFARVAQHLPCTNIREKELAADANAVLRKLSEVNNLRGCRSSMQQQDEARQRLRRDLLKLEPVCLFARYSLAPQVSYTMTKFGPAPAGSLLSCQQPLLSHEFRNALRNQPDA
ncbi:hypothetical protein HPB49_013495 [Dermacentor silvarum]|uniref:Uncharacterized protein n=1 Tax=Dermacentor silvarum TaxID=543639 RepID=A0ACB8DDH6_DERSI|nr:uncharacterized protein LOC119443104 [Dermacentor silvarum]KAH7966058.1 hypothetical protein HPB49_013495 [Dermacentor silvarum]